MSQSQIKITKYQGIPIGFQLTGGILSLIALIYAIRTRSAEDFIKYGAYIFSAVFIIMAITLTTIVIKSGNKPKKTDIIAFSIIIFIILPTIGIVYYSVFASLKDAYLFITTTKNFTILLASSLALLIGSVLFYFRLKARALYGITEAAVGLLVAANRVATQSEQITSSNFYLAMLTASVYLIVRGLDNIHQGIYKEPKDQFALKLFDILKTRM